MSSFEWNKIIASVLTAMIVAMVAGVLSSQLVRPKHLEHAAYLPPGAEEGAAVAGAHGASGGAAKAAIDPIEPMLVKADAAKGQALSKPCLQCHTFEKGGANKIGPNLFGVLEENIASVPNYQFSPALAAHKSEKWDPDKLNLWLFRPQEFAKGTKMSFPGMLKVQDRADIVAYLQSLK